MIPSPEGCWKSDSREPVQNQGKGAGAPAGAPRANRVIASSRPPTHIRCAVAPSSREPTQHAVLAARRSDREPTRTPRGASGNILGSRHIADPVRPRSRHAAEGVEQRESRFAQTVSVPPSGVQTHLLRELSSPRHLRILLHVVTRNVSRGCAQLFRSQWFVWTFERCSIGGCRS